MMDYLFIVQPAAQKLIYHSYQLEHLLWPCWPVHVVLSLHITIVGLLLFCLLYYSPINFLDPRHRLVYVLACGVIASSLLFHIIQSSSLDINNRWLSDIIGSWVLYAIITDNSLFILDIYIVIIISVLVINTYPILACVQAPVPILGYALGIMYTDIL